jgi:dethiobiotin synthetase
MTFFITGTDTAVGKTYFTAWLVRSWRRAGLNGVGLKPLATGDRADAQALYEAADRTLPIEVINPLFFQEPAAPLVAARAEGKELTAEQIRAAVANQLRFVGAAQPPITHVVIEGVGGWRVPLAEGFGVREWARELGFPVIIVALNRLGVLNHTLLTVESVQAAGLSVAAIILNEGPAKATSNLALESNADCLRSFLGKVPILQLSDVTLWNALTVREGPFS